MDNIFNYWSTKHLQIQRNYMFFQNCLFYSVHKCFNANEYHLNKQLHYQNIKFSVKVELKSSLSSLFEVMHLGIFV